MHCPTCDRTGKVNGRKCPDCEGAGVMTRDQQSRYFWESGYSDAEHERDAIARREQETEERWKEEERQAEEDEAEREADYEEEQRAKDADEQDRLDEGEYGEVDP